MYEIWQSEEAARGAVAERRRQRANRKTIAATVAALTLGWMLNAGSVVVSLPAKDQSTAFGNYVSVGVTIGAIVAVAVLITIAWRSIEPRLHRWLRKRAFDGPSQRFEAALWFTVTAAVAALMGTSVAFAVAPFGISRLQAGLAVGLPLMIIFVIARYLIPAEKRLEVTTQVLRESRRADELASFSEGELVILERLAVLEATIATWRATETPPVQAVGPAPFESWAQWWRARPRARR